MGHPVCTYLLPIGFSDEWVGGHGGDAALVLSVAAPLHLDVALGAPLGRPRVLDQPVAGAVPHHQHAVVKHLLQ